MRYHTIQIEILWFSIRVWFPFDSSVDPKEHFRKRFEKMQEFARLANLLAPLVDIYEVEKALHRFFAAEALTTYSILNTNLSTLAGCGLFVEKTYSREDFPEERD